MPEETHLEGTGGSSSQAGGDGSGDGKPKVVPYDTYDKSVKTEKQLRQTLQETRAKLDAFEAEKQAIEEQKLLSEKKHVELIEQLKREKSSLEQEKQSLWQDRVDSRKLNAALGLLQEKGISLESKYLGLIPLDRIEISDEGGIDFTSVTKVITDFQKEHPRLTAPAKAFLPGDKPGNSANMISYDEWRALPYKEKTEALKSKRVREPQKS